MKNKYIIDTNLIVIANDDSPQISTHDIELCKDFLISIYEKNDSFIYLDSLSLILEEYFKHGSYSGRPGIGDAFAKWLHINQANPEICKTIDICISSNDRFSFDEFPSDEIFSDFDYSDRKFVAVAIRANKEPTICNGSDSDWYEYLTAFNRIGVNIKFICIDKFNEWENIK